MMPARHQGLLRLFIACALPLLALQSAAAADWQLEKVVELSRHGIRPPTAGNREAIEAATGRPWTEWTTHDGELTGHGYAAVVNKGRAEGQHYRQLGLLQAGCPTAESIYVRASPLQRTRATAQALVDGAFPGCGVAIHYVSGDADPLFTDKFAATQTDPARQLAAVKEKAGDLAQRRQALAPTIQLLKQAVCQADKPCPIFDTPWQVEQSKNGKTTISGLSVMANMVETLRLGWSENLPLSQLAWGKITRAGQITALLPLLTENYDLSNDVLYTAQKRGSVLLNAMLDGVKPEANPNVRWLLLVAHDTNIAMVRTLMNFSWQLPGYSRGISRRAAVWCWSAGATRRAENAICGSISGASKASTTCVVCRRRTRSTRCCVRSGVSRAAVRPTLVRCVPSRRPSPRWVSVSTGHPPRR